MGTKSSPKADDDQGDIWAEDSAAHGLHNRTVVVLKTRLMTYLSVAVAGIIAALESKIGEKHKFMMIVHDDSRISLLSVYKGTYVMVDSKERVIASAREIGESETFTMTLVK